MSETAERDLIRRLPRQERSKVTVDVILQATAQILERNGTAAVNTNHIATIAGVSIGSVYQYFPGKQALLVEVSRRHHSQLSNTYDKVIAKVGKQSLEASFSEAIGGLVGYLFDHQRLHVALEQELELMPEPSFPEAVNGNPGMSKIRTILEAYQDEICVRDLDLASFILGRTFRQVICGWLKQPCPIISAEAITEELVTFAMAYLSRATTARCQSI